MLQQKAESQRAVIQSLQHDLEGSRRRHEQERVEELKRAEELHAKQVHRLTNLSNDLKGEVEKLAMKVVITSSHVIIFDILSLSDVDIIFNVINTRTSCCHLNVRVCVICEHYVCMCVCVCVCVF